MYSRLSHLVFGFHGCDRSTYEKVISGAEDLSPSRNNYDWLGGGVYFWEQNLDRAEQWAQELKERGKIDEPAVIGAVIDL